MLIPQYIAASNICSLPVHHNEVVRNIASGKPVISARLHGILRGFGHDNGVIYVDQPTKVLEKVIGLMNDYKNVREYRLRRESSSKNVAGTKLLTNLESTSMN